MLGDVTGRFRPPRLAVALVATLGLAAAGCAGLAASLRCPEEGGPSWRELATDHFQVWTDLEPAEAGALAERLEWIHAAVVAAAWQSPVEPESRMGVVALRSHQELRPFIRGDPPGWVIPDPDQLRLVFAAPSGEVPTSAVAREVALHLADLAWLRQPRWLRAGLAAYLETVTPIAGGATALVGLEPAWVRRTRRAGVPALLAWDARDARRAGEEFRALNASAWELVHFLVDDRGKAFADFQGRLGAAQPTGRAWRESFPAYRPEDGGLDRLERDLAEWAGRGRLARRAVPVPRPAAGPVERPVLPSQIHALWATLFLSVPAEWAPPLESRRAGAKQEVALALAHDPAEPAALVVSVWLAPERERSARARAAARAAPGDWRIWLLLAGALGPGDAAEREAALGRARDLAPDEPPVLMALARQVLSAGRPEEAVALARQAVDRAVLKAFPLDLLSRALAAAGRCPEALAAARRALEIIPDWVPSGDRQEMAARHAALDLRCGAGQGPRAGE
jgi:tetratricopeptide (TPR) repeat protein